MNIEELKRLAEAATPGPWKVDKCIGARSDDWVIAYDAGDKGRGLAIANVNYSLLDAKYIAAANPAAVLELIAEVERVTKQRDELLAALKMARTWIGDGENGEQFPRKYWTPEYAEAIDMADAAIAKAEG